MADPEPRHEPAESPAAWPELWTTTFAEPASHAPERCPICGGERTYSDALSVGRYRCGACVLIAGMGRTSVAVRRIAEQEDAVLPIRPGGALERVVSRHREGGEGPRDRDADEGWYLARGCRTPSIEAVMGALCGVLLDAGLDGAASLIRHPPVRGRTIEMTPIAVIDGFAPAACPYCAAARGSWHDGMGRMVNRDYRCGLTYTVSGYISGDLTQPPRQLAAARGCGATPARLLVRAISGEMAKRGMNTDALSVAMDWLAERGL